MSPPLIDNRPRVAFPSSLTWDDPEKLRAELHSALSFVDNLGLTPLPVANMGTNQAHSRLDASVDLYATLTSKKWVSENPFHAGLALASAAAAAIGSARIIRDAASALQGSGVLRLLKQTFNPKLSIVRFAFEWEVGKDAISAAKASAQQAAKTVEEAAAATAQDAAATAREVGANLRAWTSRMDSFSTVRCTRNRRHCRDGGDFRDDGDGHGPRPVFATIDLPNTTRAAGTLCRRRGPEARTRRADSGRAAVGRF
jgi:hypothetical protein